MIRIEVRQDSESMLWQVRALACDGVWDVLSEHITEWAAEKQARYTRQEITEASGYPRLESWRIANVYNF